MHMTTALKVRDRTTNKVRDALVNKEDYDRLKENKYLTDKNSKEPFREVIANGKRQRIALKRDVMGLKLGDPRRVFYVDKTNVFDCRKTNLESKVDVAIPIVKTESKLKQIKLPVVKEIISKTKEIIPQPVEDMKSIENEIKQFVLSKLGISNCTIQVKLEI